MIILSSSLKYTETIPVGLIYKTQIIHSALIMFITYVIIWCIWCEQQTHVSNAYVYDRPIAMLTLRFTLLYRYNERKSTRRETAMLHQQADRRASPTIMFDLKVAFGHTFEKSCI